jgi:transcription elongation GreA/GreB family factor/8-oxo-dGTP pyrophosphatase MutT (NUDIX family)
MALRVDEVEMPGGHVAVREIVEHPGSVAVAALTADRRLAVIEQYRHAVRRRLRELPAGLLDVTGEDPAEAAARELAEEAGLAAADWSVLLDLAPSPGFTDESVRVYLARELTEVERPAPADDEEAELSLVWLPVADAVRAALAGDIVNAVSVAAVLAVHAVVTSGELTRPADAPWRDRPTAFATAGGGRKPDIAQQGALAVGEYSELGKPTAHENEVAMTMHKRPGVVLNEDARHRLEGELAALRDQREALGAGDGQRVGDRADDAETLRMLDDAALLDGRIAEVTRLLAGAAPTSGFKGGKLLLDGSVVTLRYGDGTVQTLRAVALTEEVVPGDEDSSLTLDSPLGRALAGHRAGDTVSYQTPNGPRRAEIVQIQPPA